MREPSACNGDRFLTINVFSRASGSWRWSLDSTCSDMRTACYYITLVHSTIETLDRILGSTLEMPVSWSYRHRASVFVKQVTMSMQNRLALPRISAAATQMFRDNRFRTSSERWWPAQRATSCEILLSLYRWFLRMDNARDSADFLPIHDARSPKRCVLSPIGEITLNDFEINCLFSLRSLPENEQRKCLLFIRETDVRKPWLENRWEPCLLYK